MITSYKYINHRDQYRSDVKELITDNKFIAIDIGAGMDYWTHPECMYTADILIPTKQNTKHFSINLHNEYTFSELLEYVKINGKFDFSVCSHTLEDLFNPILVINLLQSISRRGTIAVPSKYNEFSRLFNNKYMGNAHHKQIIDVIDNVLTIFPKFSFIETLDGSKKIRDQNKGFDLILFWEYEIPCKIFGNEVPFNSDDALINTYFNELGKS